jgi:Ni/Co efflux regulator RcnB
MNKILSMLIAASTLAAPFAYGTGASAAPYHHDSQAKVRKHDSWVRGHRISDTDRRRAVSIDYRRHHLPAPPRGYRWIRIDSSFLLIGGTSGLISNVVVAR